MLGILRVDSQPRDNAVAEQDSDHAGYDRGGYATQDKIFHVEIRPARHVFLHDSIHIWEPKKGHLFNIYCLFVPPETYPDTGKPMATDAVRPVA